MAGKSNRRKTARIAGHDNADSHAKFRTRWRHVLKIDQEIRAGRAPNCRQLAAELEVSRRTILRDIDFMRYDLGAPVEHDPKRRGYVYTEPNWVMPSVRITEGELFALMVAEQALEAYQGTPWAENLARIFDRITAALPDRVEVAPRDLLSRVSFGPDSPAAVAPEVMAAVAQAVSANSVLELTYRPLGRPQAAKYLVDPYLLRRARGAWYLIARDRRRGHVPMFHLSRVEGVRPTGATFDYDASGFDPKAYFASTFGVYQTSSHYHVVIEFSGWAADLVRERLWTPSQVLRELPRGRLRFEADASHLDDVWPWVLSWGDGAKVIRPKELAEIIAGQAKDITRNYQRMKTTTNRSS
ncbi:MAG: WYL domain-containing protein [Planctomycetota bacterium]|nr:WYL domain-containing protein [Planctomycetota bacterium]